MPLNTSGAFDDTHDVYDPSTFTTYFHRPQQQAAPNPAPSSLDPLPRPSSAHSSHSLRRVRRESDIRNPPRRRVVSAGVSDPQSIQSIPVAVQPAQSHTGGLAALSPALSEARTGTDESTLDNPHGSSGSYWPRRSTTVTPRTASAILFALEEAIRKPIPFTTDWDEVNASMSDLVGVAGSGGFAGTARAQNGASRASQGPVPINTHPPSGVRTPTDIMRQRRDREARRKAEQEARARGQEEVERRRQMEQNQQPYAAVAAGERVSQRRPTVSGAEMQRDVRTANPASAFAQHAGGSASIQQPEYQAQSQVHPVGQNQQRPAPPPGQQGPALQQQQQFQESGSTTGPHPGPGTFSKQQTQGPPTNQLGASQSQQQLRRAPFPHAFERWENLSSHWEGLTGYWIRKLEQNNDALEKDPVSQQMARQVTDLSAAGANLFHAVVELQRLRASSERKFQRWFFDTRSELERAKEIHADLERQVRTEQQARGETYTSLQKAQNDRAGSENLLKDMRRELQISKEEARRAWEELGRREQEERDRTTSLRNGEPTLVGGVQVVPMIQGLPSRQNSTSRPQTRTGPYPGGPGPTSMGTEAQANPAPVQYYEEPPESPTVTDPFAEGRRQPVSSVAEPPVQTGAHFFEQEEDNIYAPGTPEPDDRSYGPSAASSEPGDEEYGHYPRDAHGRVVYPTPMSEGDEYEQGSIDDDEQYEGTIPATSAPGYPPQRAGSVDYSGSDWGMPTGWESVAARHHQPTRLSDVLEEDEMSRASPSRASRSSRGIR